MPVPKKRTTSTSEAAKVESSDHTMPDAQEFRHHLRDLAVNAMRSVIEEVMREEHLLTYYDFPQVMHRYIRTTNAIESFFSNAR